MSPVANEDECATVTMRKACAVLGISTPHGYDLVAEGTFPCRTVRLGHRIVVLRTDLEALVGGRLAAEQRPMEATG
jgi:predicted DNA-binding transcriptional regulator AlpA